MLRLVLSKQSSNLNRQMLVDIEAMIIIANVIHLCGPNFHPPPPPWKKISVCIPDYCHSLSTKPLLLKVLQTKLVEVSEVQNNYV